jgi:hypothetical protein
MNTFIHLASNESRVVACKKCFISKKLSFDNFVNWLYA